MAKRFDGLVFDLDGVVTRTAAVHAAAWKATFDVFLAKHDTAQAPFDEQGDYRLYVDGKPRKEGVRSFLASRDIELPEGNINDTVADGTVVGIANTKNQRFLALVREQGVAVFDDAVRRIRRWREEGMKTAIVSSSRNCRAILEGADLGALFDVRVDGTTLDELGLAGKPAPDMFLEAARRLGIEPRRAVVFEDAIAGVEAARRGGFGLVVGVDRSGRGGDLHDCGADLVIDSFEAFELPDAKAAHPVELRDPADLEPMLQGRAPAWFLDYDGTLTPIVQRPEMAILSESMRETLRELASTCTVAIVSGRDRRDVSRLVDLETLVYAGSHGFDIGGPDGLHIEHEVGEQFVEELDVAEKELRPVLGGIEGAQLERKKYSIAAHYRNVADDDVARVREAVNLVLEEHAKLRRGRGKKVLELQPDIEWDKGRAVLWLIKALRIDERTTMPIYIGDDETDEDAFRALRDRGLGIAVAPPGRLSAASCRVDDPAAVERLLRKFVSVTMKEAP